LLDLLLLVLLSNESAAVDAVQNLQEQIPLGLFVQMVPVVAQERVSIVPLAVCDMKES